MIFIGQDNGCTGSIAILGLPDGPRYYSTPVFEYYSYQKAKTRIHRIDVPKLKELYRALVGDSLGHLMIERPMVMPARFAATVSALRSYEASLIAAEEALPNCSIETIDSRVWQKRFLPIGAKGPELKVASMQRGCELFPQFREMIGKRKEADALLIAEHCRKEHS